ncbi:hypothetical protein [Nocardioides euryhalodurans]|uniref:DUF2127 domain-containing protein n=1 Tax=Nocardioides euryhalodurans TaxID=2518370 RepID=A0A4P7GGJ7_9ACTN|nr:hypothetical protein [Nocardioides euryhalodurans]QBR90834.1 hypothetical protein EXE57_00030 [Nocardioides euryhalodurans]
MGRQRPRSVTNAVRVQAALVLVTGIGTAMVAVLRDDLLQLWADSRGGLDAVEQSSIPPPAFVPVAVVSFIVYALLVWVLASLFGKGHRWARYALGATAVAFVFSMLVIYRAEPPALLLGLGAVAVVLNGVLVWLLAHRDTAEFIRGAQLAEQRSHTS